MKRIVIGFMLFLLVSTSLFADTIYLPTDCKEVKSATISTGGGKHLVMYAKVLCKMQDGSNKLFLSKKITVSSLLGFSRYTLPKVIDFKYDTNLHNKIEWR